MNPCRKCGTEFSPPPYQIKRGLFYCRPCCLRLERIREANRKALGRKRTKPKVDRAKKAARHAILSKTPEHKKRKAAEAKKRYYDPAHTSRKLARFAVRNARRRGDIIRPEHCTNCGLNAMVYAHHWKGYEEVNWLEVQWLCRPCHDREHYAAIPPALREPETKGE